MSESESPRPLSKAGEGQLIISPESQVPEDWIDDLPPPPPENIPFFFWVFSKNIFLKKIFKT